MRVTGQSTLNSPIGTVFAALHDPAVLVRTIPGCQRLEATGPDHYRMAVTAGVAAVKGTFAGEVRLSDAQPPHAFTLTASGSGAPGTVAATVAVRLSDGDSGGTVVAYDADADVGGMIGGVGQRLLASVAHRTAAEFFAAVDAALAGPAEGSAPAGAGPAGSSTPGDRPAGVDRAGAGPAGAGGPAGGGDVGTGVGPVAAGTVFRRPVAARGGALGRLPGEPPGFLVGAAFGAGVALLGALVGGLVATRAVRAARRRPSGR